MNQMMPDASFEPILVEPMPSPNFNPLWPSSPSPAFVVDVQWVVEVVLTVIVAVVVVSGYR